MMRWAHPLGDQSIEIEVVDAFPDGYIALSTNLNDVDRACQYTDIGFSAQVWDPGTSTYVPAPPRLDIETLQMNPGGPPYDWSDGDGVDVYDVSLTEPIRIRMESDADGTQRIYVDDTLVLTYIDPAPVSGSYVGMCIDWGPAFRYTSDYSPRILSVRGGVAMNPVSPEFLAALRGPHRIVVEVDVLQFGTDPRVRPADRRRIRHARRRRRHLRAVRGDDRVPRTAPGRPDSSAWSWRSGAASPATVTLPSSCRSACSRSSRSTSTATTASCACTGMDRSKYALDARLEDDVTVTGTTLVLDVVAQLIATAVPHAPLDLPTGTFTVPEVVFETKTPPWEAVQQLVAAIGKQPRFDGLGTFRLVDVMPPIGAPVWTIDEGADRRPRVGVGVGG